MEGVCPHMGWQGHLLWPARREVTPVMADGVNIVSGEAEEEAITSGWSHDAEGKAEESPASAKAEEGDQNPAPVGGRSSSDIRDEGGPSAIPLSGVGGARVSIPVGGLSSDVSSEGWASTHPPVSEGGSGDTAGPTLVDGCHEHTSTTVNGDISV